MCRANLHRDLAPCANRIDRDDRRCAGDPRTLHAAQSERSAADDGHDRAGLDERNRLRCGGTESSDGHAAAHHPEIGSRGLGEDRHDPLFERDHELGQPADVRVRIHGRAVTHVGDRHEIVGALTAEELAHVGAAAQALIAGPALRGAGHADAIADLHAAHLGPDRLNDAHAAVALDERHRGEASAEIRPESEHGAGIRVTEIRGFGADHDLPSTDRSQRQVLNGGAPPTAAARDPSAKPASGDNGGALRCCRAGT